MAAAEVTSPLQHNNNLDDNDDDIDNNEEKQRMNDHNDNDDKDDNKNIGIAVAVPPPVNMMSSALQRWTISSNAGTTTTTEKQRRRRRNTTSINDDKEQEEEDDVDVDVSMDSSYSSCYSTQSEAGAATPTPGGQKQRLLRDDDGSGSGSGTSSSTGTGTTTTRKKSSSNSRAAPVVRKGNVRNAISFDATDSEFLNALTGTTTTSLSSSDHQAVMASRRRGGRRPGSGGGTGGGTTTSTARSAPKRRGIKKAVSFGEVRTVEVAKLEFCGKDGGKNLSKKKQEKLKKEIWYTADEIASITDKNYELVDKADSKGIQHVDGKGKHTVRGLEYLLPNDKMAQKRHVLQSKSRKAVLYEQYRQKQLGIHNPTLIKETYKANGAKKCSQVAKDYGKHDEDIAISIKDQLDSSTRSKKKGLLSKVFS